MGKIPSILVGVAGEYFVAAELSCRGYIASISMRNTRGIDILATNEEATRSITIQCKANQDVGASWILNKKSEDFAPQNHFYVFVALTSPEERPHYHVVPASVVAEYTSRTHKEWLAGGECKSVSVNWKSATFLKEPLWGDGERRSVASRTE